MVKKVIRFFGVRLSFVLLIIVLAAAAIIFGLMLGYGVLGGGKPTHIFNQELWHEFFKKLNPR